MNNDGKGKVCPWGKKCETCLLAIEMKRQVAGLQQKFITCAFLALVQMISELNAKAAPPPVEKFQLPPGIRF